MDDRSKAAGKAHLGQGNGQSTFGQVVAGGVHLVADRIVDFREELGRQLEIHARDTPAWLASLGKQLRAAKFFSRQADEIELVTRLLQVHGHAASYVWDMAHRRDQKSR